MSTSTVAEFKDRYRQFAQETVSGGIERVAAFVAHGLKSDKQFRDELTAIYGYLVTTEVSDELEIEIGGEKENFDAQVDNKVLEVVRAIPSDEHVTRKQVATGSVDRPEAALSFTCSSLAALIKDALIRKTNKHYSDVRTLLISVNGEDTQEDDALITQAIDDVRADASLGPFESIWVVESGRRIAYKLLPTDT